MIPRTPNKKRYMGRRKQFFIVAVEVNEILEPKFVSLYVETAIRRYDQTVSKMGRSGLSSAHQTFLDGPGIVPKFLTVEVDTTHKEDVMRDIIMMIKSIRDGDRNKFLEDILDVYNLKS